MPGSLAAGTGLHSRHTRPREGRRYIGTIAGIPIGHRRVIQKHRRGQDRGVALNRHAYAFSHQSLPKPRQRKNEMRDDATA